jgi:Ca2+-binding RTX toxin-like protein
VDRLYGGDGPDHIEDNSQDSCAAREDPNVLSGGGGDDYLFGNTRLYGGPGDDTINVDFQSKESKTVLVGGPGLDRISADRSADTIYARDGERDHVSCKNGIDTVYFDEGLDRVSPIDCENLNPPQ